jgi:hypothetical protein
MTDTKLAYSFGLTSRTDFEKYKSLVSERLGSDFTIHADSRLAVGYNGAASASVYVHKVGGEEVTTSDKELLFNCLKDASDYTSENDPPFLAEPPTPRFGI